MIDLPRALLVESQLETHRLTDVPAATMAALDRALASVPLERRRIAVGVGSRGIDRLPTVVRTVVDYLRGRGAAPFVIPAMGSHGGATPAGQTAILAALGVTPESAGAEIRAEMEAVEIGRTASGARALMAREVLEADGSILINRVKPHTDFGSPVLGSGLRKMSVIGLGKADGAAECHRASSRQGHESAIDELSTIVLDSGHVLCGVALVEDPHHHLAMVEALRPEEIPTRESELLTEARRWMPRLPFPAIDVLIVDEMGKNISGAGMDTNVIGRGVDGGLRSDATSRVAAIYVRSLTPESRGNAIGLGLADVASSALVEQLDFAAMYRNALSSMTPVTAKVPMHFDTDAECVRAALRIAGVDAEAAGIVRIRSTLALDRFIASERYAKEIARRSDLRLVGPIDWRLGVDGRFDPQDWYADSVVAG
jgi:hypothetical protein